jgi:hypothetical protein
MSIQSLELLKGISVLPEIKSLNRVQCARISLILFQAVFQQFQSFRRGTMALISF